VSVFELLTTWMMQGFQTISFCFFFKPTYFYLALIGYQKLQTDLSIFLFSNFKKFSFLLLFQSGATVELFITLFEVVKKDTRNFDLLSLICNFQQNTHRNSKKVFKVFS